MLQKGEPAGETLRRSEGTYRALFDSIDLGFCILQLIFDAEGQPVDYRYLDLNPTCEQQLGAGSALGKTSRELAPEVEPLGLQAYGKVALTGEPTRVVEMAASVNRWFEVSASRIGPADARQVAVFLRDVTRRKRRDANVAFLADVQEDFSRLTTVDEILQTVGAKLGAFLDVPFVYYTDVDETRDEACPRLVWNPQGVQGLAGVVRLSDFLGHEFRRAARAGETIVCPDTQHDARIDAVGAAAAGIFSFVAVPHAQHGRWKFHLAVCDGARRDWADDELALLEELAIRLYPRLERARAEEALRASEEVRRVALESGRMGAWRWDLRARTCGGDPVFLALFGLPPSERPLPVEVFIERMAPASGRQIAAVMEAGMQPGEEFDGEVLLASGPTAGHWIRWQGRASSAEAHLINGVSFDVSREKWAQERFQRNEERQAFLLKLSDALRPLTDPVAIQAAASRVLGRHLRANRVGYAEADADGETIVVTQNYTDGVPGIEGRYRYEDYGARLLSDLQSGRPKFKSDVRGDPTLTDAEKTAYATLQIGATANVPLVKAGRLVAVLFVHHRIAHAWSPDEVTLLEETAARTWSAVEHARAEASLRESEARTGALSANLPGGAAFILDRNLRYRLADGEALRASGFQSSDFLGKTLFEALRAEVAALHEPFLRRALAGEAFTIEHADHGKVFLSRGTPLHDVGDEVSGVLVVSYDITDRKRAEDAVREARAEAEVANAAKDHFLAVLSHELRTPLTPVLMAAAALGHRPDLPKEAYEALEMIQRNVELEAGLVDDLLDVTRIARGKMGLARAPTDLHEAVAHAVEVCRPDFIRKGQRLTVALEARHHRLEGDPARLRQVVWNLLKNASKFTPPGGQVSVRTYHGDAPDLVGLEVVDTGIGIKAEALGRIFDAFTQADATITRQFGGLGLGLAISKAAVEAHGGKLRAESAGPGCGATFTVSLPLLSPTGRDGEGI